MISYVVNVRMDQLNDRSGALHLRRLILQSALEAAGHDILLFAPQDEDAPGYFGTAIAGDPIPDPSDRRMYWLPLNKQRPLDRPMTLRELRALGMGETPYHVYSRPIRQVPAEEYVILLRAGVLPAGFGENEVQPFDQTRLVRTEVNIVRSRELRFEMIDAYGPKCAFLRKEFRSLNGMRYGIDVGHIWPRYAGGPDIIQNVLPMSKDVNNQWDEGLISLTNAGDLLIAANAGDDTRSLFSNFERIAFPTNVQLWPDAQYLEKHRDEIFEKGPTWIGNRD